MPLVSVVIVSFQSRDTLPACLESIHRNAGGVPFEVIVVDNASRDGTVEWLAATHPGVRVIDNADHLGFTRGVNQGLALARGDALFLLSPDCEILPGAFERLLGALRVEPGIAAVGPALVDPRGRVARSCGRFPNLWTLVADHFGLARAIPGSAVFGGYKYGDQTMETLGPVGWASGAALMIARPAYERIGGLDERIFMYLEEVDWCRRATGAGLVVRYEPSARVVHIGQQSSRRVPHQIYQHNLRSRVYYFRKHHGPVAALAAKAILYVGLALKWLVSRISPARREAAALYAAGLTSVWGAAWR
jgi:GT2 family glycosyltransferase